MTEGSEITKLEQRLDQKILQIVLKSVGPDEFHPWSIATASYLTTKALGITSPSSWDVLWSPEIILGSLEMCRRSSCL